MLRQLIQFLRPFRDRQIVRPWALLAPILVLVVALPLLRPIRYPLQSQTSPDETVGLLAIQSLAERGTLGLEQYPTGLRSHYYESSDHKYYPTQAPTLSFLLSGPYWLMHHWGLSMDNDAALVAYLLTVIGVTLPVAIGAGLVYRMGRLFELARPVRAALATVAAFGSGLVSYATVLNPHAPAAALVLGAAACIIYVLLAPQARHRVVWLLAGGFCAALAAAIDPPAGALGLLMMAIPLAMRVPIGQRLLGVCLYGIGAASPIILYIGLCLPSGQIQLPLPGDVQGAPMAISSSSSLLSLDDYDDNTPSVWGFAGRQVDRLNSSLVGSHGLFSHFPVLIFGLLGVGAVMHRHWPTSTKVFAVSTVAGTCVVIAVCILRNVDWTSAMYASRWFIVFTPLLVFWMGAWLRRSHRAITWTLAGAATAFSIVVTVIGSVYPQPPRGYTGYTPIAALHRMSSDHRPTPDIPPHLLAASRQP